MSVITKLYDDYPAAARAQDAVNALGLAGVETSILGNESVRDNYPAVVATDVSGTATGAGVGAAVGGGAGLLAGLGMLAIPGVGPLVAAGWLAATAVGAVGGAVAGGAIGALADLGVPEEEYPVYSEAFRRGSIAVSVRFPEDSRSQVEAALASTPAPHLRDLRSRYEADGWRADETAAQREARLGTTMPPIPPRGF